MSRRNGARRMLLISPDMNARSLACQIITVLGASALAAPSQGGCAGGGCPSGDIVSTGGLLLNPPPRTPAWCTRPIPDGYAWGDETCVDLAPGSTYCKPADPADCGPHRELATTSSGFGTTSGSTADGSGGLGGQGGSSASSVGSFTTVGSTSSTGDGGAGNAGGATPSQSASSGTSGGGRCCYLHPVPYRPDYFYPDPNSCLTGRPLVAGGVVRLAAPTTRADWQRDGRATTEDGDSLSLRARSFLAHAWERDAAGEHASVASFAHFVLELMALGAPPELVDSAIRAMQDESEHAKLCYGLASRHASTPVGPGPLDVGAQLPIRGLVDVVRAAVEEGCVGETIAAILADEALSEARDPQARHALTVIASDEARHAELAYRFVAWALGKGDSSLMSVVEEAFDRALSQRMNAPILESSPEPFDLAAHGRLSPEAMADITRRVASEVIAPARAALRACIRPDAERTRPAERV